MVVDEQEVEENEWDESGTGASTPDKVHSTEAVAEHKSETMSRWLGIIWICEGTRRMCELGRMSRGTPRRHESGLIGAVIGLGYPFQFLLVRYGSM